MPDPISLAQALPRAAALLWRLQSLAVARLFGPAAGLDGAELDALAALVAVPRAATAAERQDLLRHAGLDVPPTAATADLAALTVALAVRDDPPDVAGLVPPRVLWAMAGQRLGASRLQEVLALRFHGWLKAQLLLDGSVLPSPVRSPWGLWTLVHLALDGDLVPPGPASQALRAIAAELAVRTPGPPGFAEAFVCCEAARAAGVSPAPASGHPLTRTGLWSLPRYGQAPAAKAEALPVEALPVPPCLAPLFSRVIRKAA